MADAIEKVDSDGVKYIEKDPDETDKYSIDWSDDLATVTPTQTIGASAWVVPTGITEVTTGVETGNLIASITVSGGTDGQTYDLTNRITLSPSGLIWDQVLRVKCVERAVNV